MSQKDRRFNAGRQSEQLYNDELYKMYGSIKHLLDVPESSEDGPKSDLHGALWLNLVKNELNYYNKNVGAWENIFREKFQITDKLLSNFPEDRPVPGQLWINQDVLMYFDGAQWKPIKALMQDGSQINLSTFENFIILSPLHPSGNLVINDEGTPFSEEGEKSQFLVPNTEVGRYFNHRDYTYGYESINSTTIQDKKDRLEGKVQSWVHVNPGKLTSIEKKIFKVDNIAQRIHVSAKDTEFYGFRRNSPYGHFLRPGTEDDGDYFVDPDGIYLSYNAAQSFDYVLAVKYDFTWIKSSGRLNRTNSGRVTTNYYVGGFGGPINVFVEGYDLENRYYHYDKETEILAIEDGDMRQDMEVSILRSIKREYGIVRERMLDGRGAIRLRQEYKNPLVFVNGEALHSSLGDVDIDMNEGIIYIHNARRDMGYCVMELDDEENNHNMLLSSGTVNEIIGRQGIVRVPGMSSKIPEDEGIILFVDGLLIKKEDIERDYNDESITVRGLERGQEFILLHDKFNYLQYDEAKLHSALVTGHVDESLVFMNDKLICNDTAIVTTRSEEELAEDAVNGEVRLFLEPYQDVLEGEYKVWSEFEQKWKPADANTIGDIKSFAFSYENGINILSVNIPHDEKDYFDVFAYSFANTIEKPLIIDSFASEDEQEFNIRNHFIHGSNALQVFLDGVRQYPDKVTEYIDGSGFRLEEPFTGRVTYIIEHPEKGAVQACRREILTPSKVKTNSPNVYETSMPLYPGRVTVYVGGLRQPRESFTIVDNHTLMFNDRTTDLLGTKNNFPDKTFVDKNGDVKTVRLEEPDEILVEIRDAFDRQEETILLKDVSSFDIDVKENNLPPEIIEAADEILIFVNGCFTGLKDRIGYMKNRQRGVITIQDSRYIDFMNDDPLFKHFTLNVDARIRWEQDNDGKPYERKANNKVTLEWR